MRKLRKYIVTSAFKELLPERSDFEIVVENIPPLRANEFLVKAEYISVDPYMRSFAGEYTVPYEQFAFQVGKVFESRNSDYPADVYVVSHSGWCDFAVLNGDADDMFEMRPYIPQIGELPASFALSALGMPGLTAYFGLLEICNPKKGDVVCVTSAAGAVGSLVGQIAKLKGCTVIGFACTDRKVKLLGELGFHHAFNYKTEANIKQKLKSITRGIYCYFDNMGGALAENIMECMKENGTVAICGAISTYGQDLGRHERLKSLVPVKMEAFSFTQWDWPKQCAAIDQMREWVQKGAIKVKETVANGFEELPDTLVAMLKGDSVGKALVKI